MASGKPDFQGNRERAFVGTRLAEDIGKMERAISVAWKMFWVGLGASAVLIAQTLVTRAPDPPPVVDLPAPSTPMPAVASLPRI